MRRLIDLKGQRFGRLTVIRRHEDNKHGSTRWDCICSCGNETNVTGSNLRSGNTRSCGCLNNDIASERGKLGIKHGESHTRLYRTWDSMVRRCDASGGNSKYYYDRGITVCEEWKQYTTFAEWARGNGYDDSLTIDRIDNDKGYSPENCRWVDVPTQNRNRRSNVVLSFRGEEKILTDWCRELNLNLGTVHGRLKYGWSVERALSTPTGTGFK